MVTTLGVGSGRGSVTGLRSASPTARRSALRSAPPSPTRPAPGLPTRWESGRGSRRHSEGRPRRAPVVPDPSVLVKDSNASASSPPSTAAAVSPIAPTATTPATIRPMVLPGLDLKLPARVHGGGGDGPVGAPPLRIAVARLRGRCFRFLRRLDPGQPYRPVSPRRHASRHEVKSLPPTSGARHCIRY